MRAWIVLLVALMLSKCAGHTIDIGEAGSSEPINPQEAVQYKQALIRCHKTGGTRIVKINGVLRCF